MDKSLSLRLKNFRINKNHRTMKKGEREKLIQDIFDRCRVTGKDKFRLADFDTAWAGDQEIKKLGEKALKKKTKKISTSWPKN